MLDDFNDFLFDVLDGFGNVNVVIDDSFYFNSLGLFDDYWVAEVDFLDDSVFNSLDDWLFNNLLYRY